MIKKSGILIRDKENGLMEWLLMLTQERYRLITEAVEKNQAKAMELVKGLTDKYPLYE